jgi:hypothetical protein
MEMGEGEMGNLFSWTYLQIGCAHGISRLVIESNQELPRNDVLVWRILV